MWSKPLAGFHEAVIAAVCNSNCRAPPLATARTLLDLPKGAKVGTSSLRRRAQLLAARPDLGIVDVRGKGLMLGIRMKVESRPFFVHLRDNHQLLTVAAGDNTIRIIPPLVIGDAEIDEFFDKLSAGAASFKVPEPA